MLCVNIEQPDVLQTNCVVSHRKRYLLTIDEFCGKKELKIKVTCVEVSWNAPIRFFLRLDRIEVFAIQNIWYCRKFWTLVCHMCKSIRISNCSQFHNIDIHTVHVPKKNGKSNINSIETQQNSYFQTKLFSWQPLIHLHIDFVREKKTHTQRIVTIKWEVHFSASQRFMNG